MSAGREYHKITGPFKRHLEGPLKNQLMPGVWVNSDISELADCDWYWREKLDGTNIRVHWDGHAVSFGGRTDRAQLPAPLWAHLSETFTEAVFEELWGGREVTLYGEGIGPGIQKGGGRYTPQQTFALFDVNISGFLSHEDVDEIALKLGIPLAPIVEIGSVGDAMWRVIDGLTSCFGEFDAEGLVGAPLGGYLNRHGERVILKIKACDFVDKPRLAGSL